MNLTEEKLDAVLGLLGAFLDVMVVFPKIKQSGFLWLTAFVQADPQGVSMPNTIEVQDTGFPGRRPVVPTFPVLYIPGLAQLKAGETEILRRMAAYPLGGNLFVAHPLRFLQDINVRLAPGVGEMYLEVQGMGTSNLTAAYDALKSSTAAQNVTIEMQSLFPTTIRGGR